MLRFTVHGNDRTYQRALVGALVESLAGVESPEGA